MWNFWKVRGEHGKRSKMDILQKKWFVILKEIESNKKKPIKTMAHLDGGLEMMTKKDIDQTDLHRSGSIN